MQKRSGLIQGSLAFSTAIVFLFLSLLAFATTFRAGDPAYADPYGNWETQNHFRIHFYDVTAVDAENAWAVGPYGSIVRTDDGGDNWDYQDSGTQTYLMGVSACDGDNAWAVGYGETANIVNTKDGGESWSVQRQDDSRRLYDVFALDPLTAWTVGEDGTVLKTEDGGESWADKSPGISTDLYAVTAVDALTAWLVGNGGTILETEDGGESWTEQYSGTYSSLRGLHALDASNLWAVGCGGTVLSTTDAGDTWSLQHTHTEYDFMDVSAPDSQNIWIVGDETEGYHGEVIRSRDGGSNWVSKHTVSGPLMGLTAVDAGTVWAAGGDRDILKTEDGGISWVHQWPGTGSVLNDVCAVDADTAWVSRAAGNALKTDDGGLTWRCMDMGWVEDGYRTLCGISAPDADTAWAVGTEGLIIKTEDGGEIWTWQDSGTDERMVAVEALDTQTVWIAGKNGTVLKTLNGGQDWQAYETVADLLVSDISAVDADTAWIVCDYKYGTTEAPILKTEDGGETWSPQAEEIDDSLYGVCALDSDNAWAAGEDGTVSKTADGGDSWVKYKIPDYPYKNINDIYALDPYTAWVIGESPYNMDMHFIYKTSDGGESWNLQSELITSSAYGVSAADACNAWVVGASGAIFNTKRGGDDKPDILSITPDSACAGETVTVSGCDFGEDQGSSLVYFGDTPAAEYLSWSDTSLTVEVPAINSGEALVTVSTPEGISNPAVFSMPCPGVYSVEPNQAVQNTIAIDMVITGAAFQDGAKVRLEKDEYVIEAYDVEVIDSGEIHCRIGFFAVEPIVYDVVVTNPDAREGRLQDGFTVTPPCGQGSGAVVMMLGLTLGLLSLAGSTRLRRRGKKV